MSPNDLLILARGPALGLALAILAFGICLRFFEIFSLGRKIDLSPARAITPGSGWRTVFHRSLPPSGMAARAPATYFAGYVFHGGLFITVFLFVPHIEFLRSAFGLAWPGLPTPVVDGATVASMAAMATLLASRLANPVKRFLSGSSDYLAWGLSFLPLFTGYLAVHHLLLDYSLMLALHILSAELLLALLPFTKLFHAFSLFVARWYNGEIFGRKGVAS